MGELMDKPCSCTQFIKAELFTASQARTRITTTSHIHALHLNVQQYHELYWKQFQAKIIQGSKG